ncbi:MAG TPA: FAD-dependent oxidoreductase, partial [Kofleriaceae bacterium]
MDDVHTLIIGAGAVGLACAAVLARRGEPVAVLERHRRPGQETSARNSGVIHAGLYYPTGSLKARLCVAGRDLLYARCARAGVPHRRCGKIVVATDDAELARIEAIARQAAVNGAE